MKKIEAFIRHEALEGLRERLAEMGLPSLTVSEIKGSGRQEGYMESYRGASARVFMRPKLKLEMVVDDADLERALEAILALSRTGEPGDGKVFVVPVEQAIRVRSGERGPEVLASH
jgi:nitrogen regulatory protein P-II 1